MALQWRLRGAGGEEFTSERESLCHYVQCLSWMENPTTLFSTCAGVSYAKQQTVARDVRSSLNPFCLASSHHLHVSITTAKKDEIWNCSPTLVFKETSGSGKFGHLQQLTSFQHKSIGIQFPGKSFSPREEAPEKGANGGKVREDNTGVKHLQQENTVQAMVREKEGKK